MPDPSLPEPFYYKTTQAPQGIVYYVRTDGNDANTGLGYTSGLAFRSIKKALAVSVGGEYIIIGPGTYAETSGSGYLNPTILYTSEVVVTSYTGTPSDVIITGTTNQALNTYITGNGGNLTFRAVTFQAFGALGTSACRMTGGTNIRFERCSFLVGNSTANGFACFQVTATTATPLNNIVWRDCTFTNGLVVATGYGILVQGSAGNLLENLRFNACVAQSTSGPALYVSSGPFENMAIIGGSYTNSAAAWGAIQVNGNTQQCANLQLSGNVTCSSPYAGARFFGPISGLYIENGTFVGGTGYGIEIGPEGAPSGTITGYARAFTATATTGHAILVGVGADGYFVSDAIGSSNGIGLVFKEVSNVVATRMTLTGGTDSGVTFKAANGCMLSNSVINQAAGTGIAIIKNAATGNKSTNCKVSGVTVNVSGTATTFNILGNTDVIANGAINDNTYHITTGAAHPYGTVAGVASIDTLAAVQAAWAGSDQPTNDSRSIAT